MPIVVAQAQFGSVTFIQGYFRIRKVTCVFAYKFLRKLDRAIGLVLLCSACQATLTDMHTDLLRSPLDLEVT